MISLSVSLKNAGHISEDVRHRAEAKYVETMKATVTDMALLKAIFTDDCEGTDVGIDHFESCESAWSLLHQMSHEAAAQAESFSDQAFFEVSFD